jgi:hypothetical protein
MSRYLDSITAGPKLPPEERLADLLTRRVGPRRGLPSLSSQEERGRLLRAMEEALQQVSEDELAGLILWVFESRNEFWREQFITVRFLGRFFLASLPTLLEQYRRDDSAPGYTPPHLPPTRFMTQLMAGGYRGAK